MKAFVWRVVYAIVCFFLFWLIFPPFLGVIGLPLPGDILTLLRACTAAIAILYVLYPSQPPMPF
jgi:hypothetical protein